MTTDVDAADLNDAGTTDVDATGTKDGGPTRAPRPFPDVGFVSRAIWSGTRGAYRAPRGTPRTHARHGPTVG